MTWLAAMGFANGPAGDALDVTFHPPAIQNAQTRHTIQGSLHAAGAGSFQRILRCVEPQIHTGSKLATKFHVVVIEKNDADGLLERFLGLENVPDDVLAAGVEWMGLAGINDLECSNVLGDLPQAVEVAQDQVGPFLAGSGGAQANGESFGIELQTGLLANGLKKIVFCEEVRGPDFFGRQAQRSTKAVIVFPPRWNVTIEELAEGL